MNVELPSSVDILIIGAGMAGASLASALAPFRSVLMIEAEEIAGYHATGRSAAFWQESYGGLGVQPLTTASEHILAAPNPSFFENSFLRPRTALIIGRDEEATAVDQFASDFRARGVGIERWSVEALRSRIAGIRPQWTNVAREPSCQDIDVGCLHQAYLRSAARAGARLALRCRLVSAHRSGAGWLVETGRGAIQASVIVNAAGAWADLVAQKCGVMTIGIQPFRRTMLQVRLNVEVPATLPLIQHVGGQFYFKGEGTGRVWLSPHDETPMLPCDAAYDEMDVAIAMDRFQSVVDWPVAAVERKWAGLRSFAPDRLPVFGPEPSEPSFIWCAGQGGFGIQTAPAIAALLGAQLGGHPLGAPFRAIDAAAFSPKRFRD